MNINELPNDIESLKKLVLTLSDQVNSLNDLVAQLRRKQYGKSSEIFSGHQLEFFDEVESESLITTPEDDTCEETKDFGPLNVVEERD